jgi:hypothetical protein
MEQWEKHGVSIVLGLMLYLFIKFPPMVRWFDFSAAPLDLGILSVVLVAALSVLTFMKLSLWLLHKNWPVMGKYAADHFERNFKSLLSWQKIMVYLGFFYALLLVFVLALGALL